jgi:hypothetical protein
VDVEVRDARVGGHFQHRVDLRLVAVHAAGRDETQHVERGAAADLHGALQGRVFEEFSGFDRVLDLGVVLVYHAPGADIHVPDFGIAHLILGQPDPLLGRVYRRVRVSAPQEIPVRFPRLADGVVVAFLAIAETVEDDQKYRRYAHDCSPKSARPRSARF